MKTKFTIFLLALLPFLSPAQPIDDGWFEVGNSNYNAALESIHYIDDNTGFAVGSAGAFLKTTDGGFNWTAYDIGYDYHFKEIVFTDSNTGFLFGSIGDPGMGQTFLLKTTDGGDNWEQKIETEGTSGFWEASFPPDFNETHTAYFLTESKRLYKTTDGGNSWDFITLEITINRIEFFNELVGIGTNWNMHPAQITTDGGETWSVIELEDFGCVIAIDAVNDTVAYITSQTHIAHTTDAGQTWSEPVGYGGFISNMTRLHFYSPTSGYRYVGTWTGQGRIYKTTDSGQTWTQIYESENYPVHSMFIRPSANVDFVSTGGAIFSGDGTNPFVMRASGIINGSLYNLWFFTNSQGIAVGDYGTVLKTENSGTTWSNYDSEVDYRLKALYFTSNNVGYAAGLGNVIKTLDGGESWTPSGNGITSTNLIKTITFPTENTGYSLGFDVFKTENAGENWVEIHDIWANDIYFVNEQTGYIIGAHGTVLKTVDAGENWVDVSLGPIAALQSVYFHSPDVGFVAGNHANIYKTTDGGENWTQVHLGSSGMTVRDIDFIDENLGYAVGDRGYIVKTEDGGDTWQQVNSNTIRDLKAIYITPDGTPFVVGQDGIVLRKVPSHTLTFNVTDTEANPIDNAVITFNGVPYSAGHYVFPGLIADDYTYSVTKAGYSVESGTVSIVDEDVIIDIMLEPSYKATFSVTGSHHGNPIAGASISIDGVGSSITNASGVAVFENLFPADEYTYEITADHYIATEGTFEIANTDIVIQISMDADLDAPLAAEATLITPFGFTANWEEVPEADSYLLYVSADGFESHLVDGLEVTGNNYMVEGANPDTDYTYRLKAANQYGASDFSNVISVTTLPAPAPDAPVALEATDITQTGFTANWEAADYAAGYYLYVSKDDFTTHIDGYDGKDITGHSEDITGLEPETTYKYRLKAYNTEGESDFSNVIEVTTEPLIIPDTPVALDATNISQTAFTANWEAADNATGYLLFVSKDDFTTHLDGYDGTDLSGLSEDLTGLEPATSYKYKLKAYNDAGESELSNIIEVTTDDTDTFVNNIADLNISIYPNPAQNHINIEGLEKNSTIEIFSITGAKMMSLENQSGNVNLDISRLENGMYIIKINSEKGVVSRKIFINK